MRTFSLLKTPSRLSASRSLDETPNVRFRALVQRLPATFFARVAQGKGKGKASSRGGSPRCLEPQGSNLQALTGVN